MNAADFATSDAWLNSDRARLKATDRELDDLVGRALREDVGSGDVTTQAVVADSTTACAVVLARGNCVIAGGPVAAAVFRRQDSGIDVRHLVRDGQRIAAGETALRVAGRASSILAAERTALNLMQRMTGIATLTAEFVRRAAPAGVTILDTRKTTPGLRSIEKYAVLCGGGANHRMGLYDSVLIKDNHRRLASHAPGGLRAAVEKCRARFPGLQIEVEVETEDELRQVLEARPDWVLLDNMEPARMARCAALCGGRVRIEASGGITLDNIDDVARSGVNAVSLGCLTHSAPSADLSLEIV